MTYRNPLYWSVVAFSGFLLILALGPGLWGETDFSGWYSSWQRVALSGVCHQQPDRSFLLSDVPMAVCSRCFGIYVAFFAGMVVVPLAKQSEWRSRLAIGMVFIALLLNIIDFVAYTAHLWQNTLFSRFIVGSLLGGTTALLAGTSNPNKLKDLFSNGTQTS